MSPLLMAMSATHVELLILEKYKVPTVCETREIFVLVEVPQETDAHQFQRYLRRDSKILVYQFVPKDIARFDQLRNLRDNIGNSRVMDMSINADRCRMAGSDITGILVYTFQKTAETGEFVPVTLDVDMVAEAGVEEVPVC